MRRRLVVGVAIGVAISAAVFASGTLALRTTRAGEAPALPEARAAFARGIEAELDLRYADARAAYAEAARIDPTWMPPVLQLYSAMRAHLTSRGLAQLDSVASRAQDPELRHCLTQLARFARGYRAAPVRATSDATPAGDCADLLTLSVLPRALGCPLDDRRTELHRARMARSPATALRCAASTDSPERWRRLQRWARAQQDAEHDALHRAVAYALEAGAWHGLGDQARALDAEARAHRDPAWGRPGFRIYYWGAAAIHGLAFDRQSSGVAPRELAHSAAMIDSALQARREAAREGDLLAQALELGDVAFSTLNTGDLERAERDWARAVQLAAQLGDDALIANSLMRLGRVHVKRGATVAAESVLVLARAAGARADSPRVEKETEHNLLHLFEAVGRDAEATRAGEAFVRFAAAGGLDQVRMMSARDYGRFLQARGASDSARVLFERMLADIDSLGTLWNYAAEYFETQGDLDRAREYYHRSLGAEEETARVLEGLTRVALAQGDVAEASRLARLHDERRLTVGRPESAALLPGVLLETRQYESARPALHAARLETSRRGQLAAWAQLTLDLAEVELALGDAARSRLFADSAAAAARSAGAVGAAQRAAIFSALAEVRGGTPGSGATARRRAGAVLAEVERGGEALLRITARRIAADVDASAGDLNAALVQFGRAADLSDSVARGIALDPDRAGFRSAQRRVYDGALTAIIAERRRPEAAAQFLWWSERRKARSLGLAMTESSGAQHAPVPQLPLGDAMLDFVLLDTLAAVLVVRAEGTSLVRLERSPDAIRAAAERIQRGLRARVGTAIDRSRARVDLVAARELSDAILAPIVPLLAGVERLTIVPDGALFLVPFDALPLRHAGARVGDAEQRERSVIDRFEVAQAMSPLAAGRRSIRAGPILMLAPGRGRNAPGASREVQVMRRVVPEGRLRVLEGNRATVAALRASAPGAAVLHFASHAEANADRPDEARVLLAADGGDDGDLEPAGISRFAFGGALVVLSACETAAGRTLEGEGVLSLSRSFLAAGAGATLATLWPVGERSADFAREFYPRLVAGETPAAALRWAKQALRAAGASPIDWAPYVLFAGGSRAVTVAALPR